MSRSLQCSIGSIRSGLFQLGEVRITLYACKILASAGMDARPLLGRHITGDWGEVNARLQRRNNKACQNFAQVESRHRVMGQLLSIVTDGQRTMTTISASAEMADMTVTGEVLATWDGTAGGRAGRGRPPGRTAALQ